MVGKGEQNLGGPKAEGGNIGPCSSSPLCAKGGKHYCNIFGFRMGADGFRLQLATRNNFFSARAARHRQSTEMGASPRLEEPQHGGDVALMAALSSRVGI